MEKDFFVYILASRLRGTLYIGVTSDLRKRVWEHKEKLADGFTKQHGADQLVWFDRCPDAISAIASEKRMKAWKRVWKLELIERTNPEWRDLYPDLTA